MVRRLATVAAATLLAGCSLKDAFTGHQDVVATAAGQDLTVERVAATIAPAKSVPLRRDVVDRIAELWVNYQLLAQTIAGGDSLLDSATVEAANWPQIVQSIVSRYHDSVIVGAKATPRQIDSAFNGPDYRYVSHILVAVKQDTTDAVKTAKRRVAENYLAQVQRGANFAQLASRVSDDPGSKPRGGNLGLMGRGVMAKAFEDAAFALRPGETSPQLVQTVFGYHILWRPALAQVRDSFAERVQDLLASRLDSVYLDSLTNRTGLSVRGGAPRIVRQAAQNLRSAKTRTRTVASWRGGRLEERQFATWLEALGPQTRMSILQPQATDSILREFVKQIARSEMLVRAAEARNIRLTHAERDSVRARYREELMQMIAGMGVAPESLAADTAVRGADRREVAARRVDAYFTALTSSSERRQYYEVPAFLADLLRARARWRIIPAGVDRALDRARTLRGPETPVAGSPLERAPIRPAPGGPPVGGQPPVRRQVR